MRLTAAILLTSALLLTTYAQGPAPPITQVTLAWDANPEPDIAGYRMHFGTVAGTYPNMVDVGNLVESPLQLPAGGTYYAVVTAYNTAGLESLPSNEVVFSTTAPGAPTGLKIKVTVTVEILP